MAAESNDDIKKIRLSVIRLCISVREHVTEQAGRESVIKHKTQMQGRI